MLLWSSYTTCAGLARQNDATSQLPITVLVSLSRADALLRRLERVGLGTFPHPDQQTIGAVFFEAAGDRRSLGQGRPAKSSRCLT